MARRPHTRKCLSYLPAALTVCVGIALSVLAFNMVQKWQQGHLEEGFEAAAEDQASALKWSLEEDLRELEALGSFYAGSQIVERGEFREFVRSFLAHKPSVQALEWIPRVPDAQRTAYEEAARRDGFPEFQITERRTQGQMVRAARRQEYFPVYFVEPYEGNEPALGFDLASNPKRLEALTRSRDTGQMAATARITLVQEISEQFGFLVFLPIYRKEAPTDSIEDRRENLEGFVLGVFRIGDILERALAYLEPQGVDIQLYDLSAPIDERFLYARLSRQRTGPTDEGAPAGLQHSITVDVAGRKWSVVCTAAPDFITSHEHPSQQAWVLLAGGLLITALLAIHLQSNMTRTLKLTVANTQLEQEITDRERAEEDLRESEVRIRAIVDNAAAGIISIDARGIIESINAAAEGIFGYGHEEVIGKNVNMLMPSPHQEEHDGYIQRYLDTGVRKIIGLRREVTGQRKDGSSFLMDLHISEVRLGERRLFTCTVHDLTEAKQAEANLEALNKQLLGASRQAGMAEVATSILHNVGNVLNSVNVSATLVREKVRKSVACELKRAAELLQEHSEDLGTFLTENQRGEQLPGFLSALAEELSSEQAATLEELESLTNNIEHIKQIVSMQQSHAQMSGVVQPVSLTELLEEAVSINSASLKRHRIRLVREYAELTPVCLDKHKLLQILVNVVTNAKYALIDGGEQDKRLTLRVAAIGDDRVRIEVIDNGVGIPPENLTRIFSLGFTTRQEGRGYGLHGSALAAKELGGSLTAHSVGPGKGATFTIELPFKALDMRAAA